MNGERCEHGNPKRFCSCNGEPIPSLEPSGEAWTAFINVFDPLGRRPGRDVRAAWAATCAALDAFREILNMVDKMSDPSRVIDPDLVMDDIEALQARLHKMIKHA